MVIGLVTPGKQCDSRSFPLITSSSVSVLSSHARLSGPGRGRRSSRRMPPNPSPWRAKALHLGPRGTHALGDRTDVWTCAYMCNHHVWGCSGAPSFLPDRAPALHRHAPLGPSHHGARPQPAELPSCGRGTPARIGSPARPGRRTPAPGASPLLPPPSRSSGSASAALKGPEHERGAPPRPPTPPRGTARLPRPQPSPLPPPSAQPHSASRAAPPHPPPAAPPQPQINTHARREVISKCRFILVCTTSL